MPESREVPQPFGTLLRRYRSASGLSQEVLAERARVSAAAIGAIERGRRRAPYKETVASLADALGLSAFDRTTFLEAADRARGRTARSDSEAAPSAPLTSELPSYFSSFVGREGDIAELRDLLSKRRLVTVTGSGGVGKTRVVVELLHELAASDTRRIAFVELAPSVDGSLLLENVSIRLGVAKESKDPFHDIVTTVGSEHLLLVLDNCEHLIKDVAVLSRALLQRCRHVSILITSRERLGITDEAVYRLPSLSLPNASVRDHFVAKTYAALRLFFERTLSVDQRYTFSPERVATSVDICRRLDGIPLALELAAARVPLLGIAGLRDRLFEQFVLSSGDDGLPLRQRTMLATIAWSFDLLTFEEQVLMRRLVIFSGGFTLSGAEAVCAAGELQAPRVGHLIAHLIELSLVNINGDSDETRYSMPESTKAVVFDRLRDAGEHRMIARQHAVWLADRSDEVDALLLTATSSDYLRTLHLEIDNIRSALAWSLSSEFDDDVLLAARILGGMRQIWRYQKRRPEARRWLEQILRRIDAERHPKIVARLYRLLVQSAAPPDIEEASVRARVAFERINDQEALLSMSAWLVLIYVGLGQFGKAEESAAQAHNYVIQGPLRGGRAHLALLMNETEVHEERGFFEAGRANLDFAEALINTLRLPEEELNRLTRLSALEASAGNIGLAVSIAQATAIYAETLPTNPKTALWVALNQCRLGAFHFLAGEVAEAVVAAKASLRDTRHLEETSYAAYSLTVLAGVAAMHGNEVTAARLLGFIDATLARTPLQRSRTARRCDDLLKMSLRPLLSEIEVDKLRVQGERLSFTRACDEALAI